MRTVLLLAPFVLLGCLPRAVTLNQTYTLSLERPNPYSTTVGDFNGDGKPDLLTETVDARGEITVMLNIGNGQFAQGVSTSISRDARVPVIADFNGDGKADLLVIDNTSATNIVVPQTMALMIGNGDGTFRQPTVIPIGSAARGARGLDVNGDGKLDVVLLAGRYAPMLHGTGRLLVMLGHGDGTFDAPRSQELGVDPLRFTDGDFNGDGKIDLAVVDEFRRRCIILSGRGDGWFDETSKFGVPFEPIDVRSADLNGDKRADLVFGVNNGVTIFLNQGDGHFVHSSDLNLDVGFTYVIDDFDHDGFLDIATARRYFHSNGSGTYRAYEIEHRDYDETFLVSADLNGDGWPDLIETDRYHQEVRIALNRGAGTAPPAAVQ